VAKQWQAVLSSIVSSSLQADHSVQLLFPLIISIEAILYISLNHLITHTVVFLVIKQHNNTVIGE